MARYKTKPFEIDAHRFTGQNWMEMQGFCGQRWTGDTYLPLFAEAKDWINDPDGDIVAVVYDRLHSTWVGVKAGQWIIRGAKGEFYPCDPEIFEAKYEAVDE